MSTNQTASYQLHLWEPGDDFLREEFNENFAALDRAVFEGLAEIRGRFRAAAGCYNGDETDGRFIDLGFRPRMVLVTLKGATTYYYHGLFVDGGPNYDGDIVDGGFAVSSILNWEPVRHAATGERMNPYRYLALWWA